MWRAMLSYLEWGILWEVGHWSSISSHNLTTGIISQRLPVFSRTVHCLCQDNMSLSLHYLLKHKGIVCFPQFPKQVGCYRLIKSLDLICHKSLHLFHSECSASSRPSIIILPLEKSYSNLNTLHDRKQSNENAPASSPIYYEFDLQFISI